MKPPIVLYQTLEDRENYIRCEDEGPFPCSWENTWLGNGYYYWYHHIPLAHWWGETRYGKGNYVIYKSICNELEKCWDLHGEGDHQSEFLHWLGVLERRDLLENSTTVAQVIEFIKNEATDFRYEAIRILGVDSLHKTKAMEFNMPRLFFEYSERPEDQNKQRYKSYFDLIPPVQVCLFNWKALNRTGFDVVFPETYASDFSGVF